MMPRILWWERFPERLEYELQALKNAGITFLLDEKAKSNGIIRLELQTVHDDSIIQLFAFFPDLYPYFRFEILAPNLNLRHHQNPFGKNLCLIGRNTANWKKTDTLAAYIQERFPQVIKAATTADISIAEALEEHQGEPVSAYYPYKDDAILLIDTSWSIPKEVKKGNLVIALSNQLDGHVIRGAIQKICTSEGKQIASGDPSLSVLYPNVIYGRWFRISRPAIERDACLFLKKHENEHPSISKLQFHQINGWDIDIVGLVFSDELTYQEQADDWIFVVRAIKSKAGGKIAKVNYFLRASRAGRSDLVARVPEIRSLPKRRVVLLGLGGIGAPVAIELARSGVGELRILDGDIVEPGTIVRWPLGLHCAGHYKTIALENFIKHHYPYTNVVKQTHVIGRTSLSPEDPRDSEVLDRLFDGVDLIYDATAEFGIQHLFSDLAAEKKIPYICASTTLGAWGGLIVRIRPGVTEGCWVCLQGHLGNSIPEPPQDPSGIIQPMGCSDPTFTGIGCDVASIALMGARLAIATLCRDIDKSYPDFPWDVAVGALREPNGQSIPLRWETFPLQKFPTCQNCAKK